MAVTVVVPTSLDAAVAVLAENPGAHLLAGGTDLMVEVNFGHRRPPAVVALRAVPELRQWRRDGDELVIGAGITWSQLQAPELASLAPGLALAARTVGSPQIRNAGTLGGNIATASPAGDALPVLYALDAVVDIVGPAGARSVPIAELVTGVKHTDLAAGEIIVAVRIPVAAGPQEFLKIGTRNAMVISVASVALVVDTGRRTLGCALGACGPTIIRCTEAEQHAAAAIDWVSGDVGGADVETFGRLAAEAARPIDDQRSTAGYRRHGVEVMARRALMRAFPGATRGTSS
jgi:CO/xanthine dehydrogenase FAD-binding subunit